MTAVARVEISLEEVSLGLKLWIDELRSNTLFDAGDSAAENAEARFQLVEGHFYEYELSDCNFSLRDPGGDIVRPRKRAPHMGILAPNIYVGLLELGVVVPNLQEVGRFQLEVQSVKTDYRNDYRNMLNFIAEKCAGLLLRADAPVAQHLAVNDFISAETLYQRFAFIKSVLQTEEFAEAIYRIEQAPVTRWKELIGQSNDCAVGRITGSVVRALVQGANRAALPDTHPLHALGLTSAPAKLPVMHKADTVDTPENRFVKHALVSFLAFCTDIQQKAREIGAARTATEAGILASILEGHLQHSIFREISLPQILQLNSPVLQRKEGYREVLRVWVLFELAAKLAWSGGEDVYRAGKKDVAVLYEYWLFFKLLDLLHELFAINNESINQIMTVINGGLHLELKQGIELSLCGIYDGGGRKLNVRFCYNRTFSGNKQYPYSGSWTITMRPDYTLSIWPVDIDESDAEMQELIVHIHFDAKYKVANLREFIEVNGAEQTAAADTENLNDEKSANRKGVYKNADLLKMHAYRDAIRRTGGAYVLYPGDIDLKRKGFHEILPGLGAFTINPAHADKGIDELKKFLADIRSHFINRISQREKLAYRTWDILRDNKPSRYIIKEALPEAYGANRGLIPDETFVLAGFYKSPEHLKWIRKKQLYNFRMGSGRGSLVLTREVVGAKYLLLHTAGDQDSSILYKIDGPGPRVFSSQGLLRLNYPEPQHQEYLLIKIDAENLEKEFMNCRWDFRKLRNYRAAHNAAHPFTASLVELMSVKMPL